MPRLVRSWAALLVGVGLGSGASGCDHEPPVAARHADADPDEARRAPAGSESVSPLEAFTTELPTIDAAAYGIADELDPTSPIEVLRHARAVTLYRVHVAAQRDESGAAKLALLDHEYVIESSGPAADPRAAAEALLRDITPGGPSANCFSPSYALRVSDGSRTVDFVICFHCRQTLAYEGQRSVDNFPLSGSDADIEAIFAANQVPVVPVKVGGPRKF
jgi:hypothetical protein